MRSNKNRKEWSISDLFKKEIVKFVNDENELIFEF